jgi:hypothetical protein
MTEFIKALDTLDTTLQYGENAHSEYTWSHKLNELILQLSFQLTRTTDENVINKLASTTHTILTTIKANYDNGIIQKDTFLLYMSIMYRMIAHTRDIIDGKGEYSLSYMLLSVWYKHYPILAKFAFKHFLLSPEDEPKNQPFGSWKDVKYMFASHETPLAIYGMELMNLQLKKDYENLNLCNSSISLAAKWVPRETSKFSQVFTNLATMYFSHYIDSAKCYESKQKAILKAKMDYRKLVSKLNKYLDTVQIKQCANNWTSIEPSKQTSITMQKQKKAFLNLTKRGTQRSDCEDRIVCATHFTDYAKLAATGKVEIKGKRVGINDFVKDALDDNSSVPEKQILNAQWLDNSNQTGTLGKMIAMVDVSGSMDGNPLYAAIGLGIRVAEKSILGARVLTFSAKPSWVNLDSCPTFVEKVQKLKNAEWGMNTNFYAAMKMILDAIVTSQLKPPDVENLILAVFSDMQIDSADTDYKSMYELIEKQYADVGMRLWGKPFKPPHILFWNLRSTSGFPCLSTQSNVSMLSGFSPALLNIFCEQGIEELQQHCNPWNMFLKSIDGKRYKFLDEYLCNYFISHI